MSKLRMESKIHVLSLKWFILSTEPKCVCCPVGRSGHRIVLTENSLYSLGGFNPDLGGYGASVNVRGHPLFKEVCQNITCLSTWLIY